MRVNQKQSVVVGCIIVALSAIVACGEAVPGSVVAPSITGAIRAASPNADTHTLRGTAEVTQMPGVTYASTIEAKLNAAGEASGSTVTRLLDLSGFGSDLKGTVVAKIDCLEVSGDSAWFGGPVESASRKELLQDPALANTIGQVKVIDGQTYYFSGPALFYTAPGTTCKDKPALPIQPVNSGKFEIR